MNANKNDHQNRRRSYKSATASVSRQSASTSDDDPLQLTSRLQEGTAAIMAGPDSSFHIVNNFKTQCQADMKGTLIGSKLKLWGYINSLNHITQG